MFLNDYPYLITDGKNTTNWWSYNPTAQLIVEFEKERSFNKVILNWSDKYARKYNLEISNDGTSWQNILNVNNGKSGINTHTFSTVRAKYLRINCLTRLSTNGYALNEVEVYNDSTSNVKQVKKNNISIYPNPAHSNIRINIDGQLPNSHLEAYLLNYQGQIVEYFVIEKNKLELNIQNLSKGLYILRAYKNGEWFEQSFIKL
ncbi:MAG: discoidin domain-containing protein [Bacteroidales bacterium]|nr:discoidin domain-containing protein [Bacteroidales bacterium]